MNRIFFSCMFYLAFAHLFAGSSADYDVSPNLIVGPSVMWEFYYPSLPFL